MPAPRKSLLRRVASVARRRARHYVTRYRLHRQEARSERPILIYTMPKVGSSSVWASLRALELPDPVYHMHLLTDGAQEFYRDEIRQGQFVANYREKLDEIEHVVEQLRGRPQRRWKVITLIRDPLARCLSSFFQGRWKRFANVDFTKPVSASTMTELGAQFVAKLPEYLELSATWFDKELQAVFDFDVFATPFDRERGFQIYSGSRADLLLVRLDDLDRCHRTAFRDFLGLGDFRLINDNQASQKAYYTAYREFSRSIVWPRDYIDQMYAVRYVRHFYSDAEIASFRGLALGKRAM